MQRKELRGLLEKIELEVKKARKRVENTHKSASEIARAAAKSPSQSGDRTHAEDQALITRNALVKLKLLKKEIETSLDKKDLSAIRVPSFIKVRYKDGIEGEFYLVKSPANIIGIMFISAESPLGKVLIGKRLGDKFDFTNDDKIKTSGKVLFIE